MPTKTIGITKAKATAVRNAIARQFAPWVQDGNGPVLDMDKHGKASIIWEVGAPDGWVFLAFDGGIEEEYGFQVKSVKRITGVYCEPVNSCVLGLYPDA